MKKITLLILFLFFLAIAISFYYYQRNIFSKEVLKLEILGPEKVKMGEEIEYTVRYKNQGNTTLEEAELIFEYPESALPLTFRQAQGELSSEEVLSEEERRVRKDLQDIYPGEEDSYVFKARLFGKEGDIKQAKAFLSYRPKNLKAFFESKTSFVTEIDLVPLSFEIDSPSRVEIGKPFSFRINYFSSADYPLSDLRVKIDYPSGFEFLGSKPVALERTEWDIDLLNKTDGGRIEISGRLEGEARTEKIFRATLGFWKEGDFILLKEATRGIQIVKPSLYVSHLINNSPEYVATPGDFLHVEIFFRNIGEEPFKDLFLVTKLKGEAFDLDTVRTGEGDFQKDEKFIFWDWKKVPLLKFLSPQEEGKVEFWVKLKEKWEPLEINPEIKAEIEIAKVKKTFVVKVNSFLELEELVLFKEEKFSNEGPIPPKVGETTTYSVIWKPKNYYNDLENVKVKATLPDQVKLTGKIFPEDANLTFDSESREIVWDVGELQRGSGISEPEKSVAFQISLKPIEDQKGEPAFLINEARVEGEDQWTKRTIGASVSAVDTTLPDDPTVSEQNGIVQ